MFAPVRTFFDLQPSLRGRNWIVAGKGPSFSNLANVHERVENPLIVGLNDVCLHCRVDVAVWTHSSVVFGQARWYWLPVRGYTHDPWQETEHIEDRAALDDAMLRRVSRIFTYHLNESQYPGNVVVHHTVLEAAVSLICMCGEPARLCTVGVDGGKEYHPMFADSVAGSDFTKSMNAAAQIAGEYRLKMERL